MPLIDLHCHLGFTVETLALSAPDGTAAKAYADRFDVEQLCFASPLATADLSGGNARLSSEIALDPRFRGWLTLSSHQTELSSDLARRYLVKEKWFGSRFEQNSDGDAVNLPGGREVINALRRYSKPVLLTVTTPATLTAALAAAREFNTLRFLLQPQNEYLTAITVPAMKEVINTVFVPVAAFVERDIISGAVEVLGERRVAWASDWGRFHPAAALGMIRDSALTAPQRERVGYRNARELAS